MPIHSDRDFFFQWHLTERCNLRCAHCYQGGMTGRELSTAEALAFIDEAAETLTAWSSLYKVSLSSSFNVTGGEPLLRPDLFELLEALQQKGIAVHLLTNGTLLDAEAAGRLRQAGVATIQVSVEGGEEVHDAIRGAGSFRAAVAGVRHLLATGLEVTLNTTLSRRNAAAFPAMLKLAAEIGAQRLGFSRLVPAGRGRGLLAEALNREELEDLYREIFSLETGGVKLVTGDPVAAQLRGPAAGEGDGGKTPLGGCAAGVFGLTVAADGTIMPCRRLPIPIGNIREHSIREIWAGSPVLAQLRERESYREPCRGCARWAACRGCRAIAFAHTGDYLAGDPQCFLQR